MTPDADRVTALEAEHTKSLRRFELLQKHTERLERAFSAMMHVVSIPRLLTDEEQEQLRALRTYVKEIRQDIDEIDRELGAR
jgi:hypothetical protein